MAYYFATYLSIVGKGDTVTRKMNEKDERDEPESKKDQTAKRANE